MVCNRHWLRQQSEGGAAACKKFNSFMINVKNLCWKWGCLCCKCPYSYLCMHTFNRNAMRRFNRMIYPYFYSVIWINLPLLIITWLRLLYYWREDLVIIPILVFISAVHGGKGTFTWNSEDWWAYIERLDQLSVANSIENTRKNKEILMRMCGSTNYQLIYQINFFRYTSGENTWVYLWNWWPISRVLNL